MQATSPFRAANATAPGWARIGATFLLPLLVVACRHDPSTPRGAAERFLDAFYVRIDLPGTLPFTTGTARTKVAEEIRLTLGEGQTIDDATRRPTITYRFLEQRPGDATTTRFLYEATIVVEDADTFQRRWLVTMRQTPDGWRVADYEQLTD